MGKALQSAALPIPQGYLFGLTLSTAGSSATFSIAAGAAADSTAVDVLTIAAFTKTTSAWAVGTANGAMDTGAVAASTWYHVFIIKRLDTGLVDILFSLSATAPTMPGSYTLFRRIGSMKTNGSSQWTLFHQLGDEFLWDTIPIDVNSVAIGTSSVLATLTVPTGVQVRVFGAAFATNASFSIDLLVSSPDQPAFTTGSGYTLRTIAAGIGSYGNYTPVRTNTSAQIRAVTDTPTSSYTLYTWGWLDDRGKLS